MMRHAILAALAALAAFTFASTATAQHQMMGGETTVVLPPRQLSDRGAFSYPATNLSLTRRGQHFAGNSFFQNAWVTAPASVAARDGLGPLFNTMSCQSCHVRDGKGRPPRPGEEMVSMLVRVSIPGDASAEHEAMRRTGGVVPHPHYGAQIQNGAIAGIQPEARVVLNWRQQSGTYPDGKPYRLRRPEVVLEDAAYGATDGLLYSPRVAPAMIGMGLLDAIDDETLLALEDRDDEDGDGISGHANRVWDVRRESLALGRFGWKAEQPTVHQQAAAAFHGDIGITSSLFPTDSLTARQREIIQAADGGSPEVSDRILDLVTFYCKSLAVPAQRGHDNERILAGRRLFEAARCDACHIPTLTTGLDPDFPELSGQTVHPYTDLLLHDMGEGLADDRPTFAASGREWRTAPLWGIGLVHLVNQHRNFLHDGRARSLEEAILWHGGEAEESRDAFKQLSAEERRQLIAFLRSL